MGGANNMESNIDHISANIKKLVEGSQQELPYNPLYTYAKLKVLYQKVINDNTFMQDPAWIATPNMAMGAPMM